MVKMLFDSIGKVLYWIAWIIIFCLICPYSVAAAFGVAIVLLIPGPCVAIPAMIARHGKHILTTKNTSEIKQAITTTFSAKKTGSNWVYAQGGMGQINYEMTQTKSGCEPIVSIDLEPVEQQGTLVSIWMSEWTHGGFNGGKGTPFWTWGGLRTMSKISDIAKAIA